MKNLKIALGLVAVATLFTSCKDEKQELAQNKVDLYERYVDSISNVAQDEAATNWDTIQSDYEKMKLEAENALIDAKDKESLQMTLESSTSKYDEYKNEVVALNTKKSKYNSWFGDAYVNDDMKFNWVNKDNILNVYENFYNTVKANKDSYSREDWDEIKLTYEAIDTRKNTVEKEGLSGSDNLKIAGIKVKFAPMFTFNRMDTKSEENSEAKK